MALPRTEEGWKRKLSPLQFSILREQGTERPFSSPYERNTAAGVYRCAGCGEALFSSEEQFDAGCGWPSFSSPEKGAVTEQEDASHFMRRTEVRCRRCGGHLGHVFDDGPKERGGLRYCINGAALAFEKEGI